MTKLAASILGLTALIGTVFGIQSYADSRYSEPLVQHQKQHICLSLLEQLIFLEKQQPTTDVLRRIRMVKQQMANSQCAHAG